MLIEIADLITCSLPGSTTYAIRAEASCCLLAKGSAGSFHRVPVVGIPLDLEVALNTIHD
jgi:hypothetical protein